MSRLPYMQFYPADWIQDTQILSLEAQGAWMKLICAMWVAPERGVLKWTPAQLDQFLGLHRQDTVELWNELSKSGVGVFDVTDGNDFVMVMSRRMIREEKLRKQNVARVRKHRNGDVTHHVMPLSRRIYQKSDIRSQNSDIKKEENTYTAKPEFPDSWKWLEDWIKKQNGGFPVERFLDWPWWDAVSETCGGLSERWLEEQSAKWRRWIMDNPQRAPTPKGYRRFIAGWLERSYERERRIPTSGKGAK